MRRKRRIVQASSNDFSAVMEALRQRSAPDRLLFLSSFYPLTKINLSLRPLRQKRIPGSNNCQEWKITLVDWLHDRNSD